MPRRALQRWGALFICVLESLSPHGKLLDWTTPGYPRYGEADNIIPSAETLWMASEMVSTVFSHLGAVWTEAGCDGSVAAAALFCFSDRCCKEGLGERESYD